MLPVKLTNKEMYNFIKEGYVVIQPNLSSEFHNKIRNTIENVFKDEGNPGNNILARIPDINIVFNDPKVSGALESVLGRNYYMHPHRHCHFNAPQSKGQVLHKDGFSRRRHRTRWILAMYYPQETTVDMGPTAFVPGSQYCNTEAGGTANKELALAVPEGSVALVHYDIWHRGTANISNKNRYMVKFLYLRMEEPDSPSWDCENPQPVINKDLCGSIWNWHSGIKTNSEQTAYSNKLVEELIHSSVTDPEPKSLESSYSIGYVGNQAVPHLIDALKKDFGEAGPSPETSYGKLSQADRAEEIRRNLSYAFTAIGKDAVPSLIDAANHSDWWVRDSAIETLGDLGKEASKSMNTLLHALNDPSIQVRRHASEAIGLVANKDSDNPTDHLINTLNDPDDVIRRNTVLSLAKIGPGADAAVPKLIETLDDNDRYVRGKALEALKRIGTNTSTEFLISHLMTSRWCDITNKESLY